jgi:isorenieratene synthase
MTAVDSSDDVVWAAVLPTILEIYPEVANLKIVARVVTTRDLFPQWAINTLAIRPFSSFAQTKGVAGLAFAGDWLTTDYPSAFMERAVSTGREAANLILLEDGVRQVNLTVTSKHGPGIL